MKPSLGFIMTSRPACARLDPGDVERKGEGGEGGREGQREREREQNL